LLKEKNKVIRKCKSKDRHQLQENHHDNKTHQITFLNHGLSSQMYGDIIVEIDYKLKQSLQKETSNSVM
jgi:hypothetical protein